MVRFIDWLGVNRNLFDLFDLKIGINGFKPIVARTDCYSRHVTMSAQNLSAVPVQPTDVNTKQTVMTKRRGVRQSKAGVIAPAARSVGQSQAGHSEIPRLRSE